jgi:hypothetical protein
MQMGKLRAVSALILLFAVGSVARATYVGEPLTSGNSSTDGDPPLVILGEYNATAPTATSSITFPTAGTVTDVQINASASGDAFTVYDAHPAGADSNGNQQFTLTSMGSFVTTSTPGVQVFTTTPFAVQAGDLLAFWGQGPLYTSGTGTDATYQTTGGTQYFATQPTSGTTYSVGAAGNATAAFQYLPGTNDPRNYEIGVDVTPEPSSVMLGFLGVVALLLPRYRARAR